MTIIFYIINDIWKLLSGQNLILFEFNFMGPPQTNFTYVEPTFVNKFWPSRKTKNDLQQAH